LFPRRPGAADRGRRHLLRSAFPDRPQWRREERSRRVPQRPVTRPAMRESADDDQEPTTMPVVSADDRSGALPSPWVPGTRFSGYQIESRLAVGGMAEVWRAKISGLEGFEKRIVIKTMLTNLHSRADLTEMFVNEASLAARLSHPNIVDVLDFGQLDGRYFIAMEYVPGLSLRVAHRRMTAMGGRLPVVATLNVMRDVCEALQHIHELAD